MEFCNTVIKMSVSNGDEIIYLITTLTKATILLINFVFYVIAIIYLLKYKISNNNESFCRKIKIATLTLLMCEMSWMTLFSLYYLLSFFYISDLKLTLFTVDCLIISLQNIVFKLCVCLFKSYRIFQIDNELGTTSNTKLQQVVLLENEDAVTYL